ncbi:MAG TPA: hypothetical protein VHG08_21665, partial [Longimicrobium sp.]|nr:hypothetical protein [Longimicrobium sp.]
LAVAGAAAAAVVPGSPVREWVGGLAAPGRIELVGAGPGEVVVTLPADADAAFVEVNGRVIAAKEGDRLRSLAPRVAGSATEPVFRAGGN